MQLRKIKGEIAALIILSALAVVLGWLLINWNQFEGKQAEDEATEISEEAVVSEEAEENDDAGVEETQVFEQEVILPAENKAEFEERQEEEAESKILLSVKGGSGTEGYEIPVEGEMTVAELMAEAAQTTDLALDYEDYGGSLGWFIKAINGLNNGEIDNHYWYFYVNGEAGEVGVSNFIVKPGDVVEWRFEQEKRI